MVKGVKMSKRWCRASSSWDIPIEEKFYKKEDENKRVYFPEIKMRKNDFVYLCAAAKRHGVTNSCELETILTRAFTYGMLCNDVILLRQNGEKQKRISVGNDRLVRKRRFMVHPSFVRLIKREAEERKISISLLVYTIFLIYKERFPIHLGVVTT